MTKKKARNCPKKDRKKGLTLQLITFLQISQNGTKNKKIARLSMTIWRKNTRFLKYQQVSKVQILSKIFESAQNPGFIDGKKWPKSQWLRCLHKVEGQSGIH